MEIIPDIATWQQTRKKFSPDKTVGFVPTMGNLHEGHASLMKRCRQANDISVLSIFINPTQFNDPQDFAKYPKTIEEDVAIAMNCGVDYVLLPNKDAMYTDNYQYKISENQISQILEGTSRPGHFEGMLTIVMKLFCLVRPHRTYFGEKDYQQLKLVQGMADAFFLDIEVIPCATVRHDDNLAMSSRNSRLTPEQRLMAKVFPKYLHASDDPVEIKSQLQHAGIDVEYVVKWDNRMLGAIKIGDVRLIDNVEVE